MASNLQWHPVSVNFNDASAFMRNAGDSISKAGTVFGELRKSILDEEQRKIEQDFKEKQLAEQIRQFGLTEERLNRVAAETERHNKADEDYKLKNLTETANYHNAYLAMQRAYHNDLINARNARTQAQYGGNNTQLLKGLYDSILGSDTGSNGQSVQAPAPKDGYGPVLRDMAKNMTGQQIYDMEMPSLETGSPNISNPLFGDPLLGTGTYFQGTMSPDISLGDAADMSSALLEDRLARLRGMPEATQMEADMQAARNLGAAFLGQGQSVQAPASSPTPIQISEAPAPVQVADRGIADSIGDFFVTPVQAGTLPAQPQPERGPTTFYKASPIGLPTAEDLRISASDFKPMDLADINRRREPIAPEQAIREMARDNVDAYIQTKAAEDPIANIQPIFPGGPTSEQQEMWNREVARSAKRASAGDVIDATLIDREGGKPRASMVGGVLRWETPMQTEIREEQERKRREEDNPNIPYNPNRYTYDEKTDAEEDAAQKAMLQPGLRQSVAREVVENYFGARALTPMGNGAEGAKYEEIVAKRQLRGLKALATIGGATGRNYAISVFKDIIARNPSLRYEGQRAIAYLYDYSDPRFMSGKGHVALDNNFLAEAGVESAITRRDKDYESYEERGKSQMFKDQTIRSFFADPARHTETYNNLEVGERTALSNAVSRIMSTTDFKDAEDQAKTAIALAETIDAVGTKRTFFDAIPWIGIPNDRYLHTDTGFGRYKDANNISLTDNSTFATTYRLKRATLDKENLTGEALNRRLYKVARVDEAWAKAKPKKKKDNED